MSFSKLSFIMLLFAATTIQGQMAQLNPDFVTYVFGDKVNVRATPASDGKVAGQLVGGEKITIIEATETTYTSGSITQPWYKVRFGKAQTGYVWGGLISYLGEQQLNGVKFTMGVTAVTPDKEAEDNQVYTLEMRVYDAKGALLTKTSENLSTSANSYVSPGEFKPGALGLKGYTALLKTGIGFEACGYPQYSWYVLWNGSKLVPLPLCTSVSDGGVFYHTESYVFPEPYEEGGRSHFLGEDRIMFMVEHGETSYPGDDESAGWDEDSYTRVRPVKWDGKKYIQPEIKDK